MRLYVYIYICIYVSIYIYTVKIVILTRLRSLSCVDRFLFLSFYLLSIYLATYLPYLLSSVCLYLTVSTMPSLSQKHNPS